MKKVMLYPDYKAVGFDITAALIRAVGMEDVPLVADGRHRALGVAGVSRYSYDTKRLLDSTGSSSFLQLLHRNRQKTMTADF